MTDDYSGAVVIDEKAAKWSRNPARGGIVIKYDGFSLCLSGEPSEARIRCALEGFIEGYRQGKQAGRAVLQNEFRNLMGLQR